MVKYLGIDYLQTALSKRIIFLSQSLLTIPQHLEHVANYPHNGTLQDDTYRTLWIQESVDRNFLTQQMENVAVDLHELVKPVAEVKLEKYEQETLFEGISFDLCDVIPSSSSDSSNIPYNSAGLELCGTANFQEVFETYTYRDYKLEEVITRNYLADTVKKLPSFKRLLSHLVPSPVSDPLLQEGQKPTELYMFRDMDEICVEISKGTSGSAVQEEFEKLNYIENECRDMELEEILSPFIKDSHVKDVTKEARKQLLQQAATYTEVEKLGPGLHELIKTEINSSDKMQLIEKADSYSSSEIFIEKSFLELNEMETDHDDDKLMKRAILDSPLISLEDGAIVDCFLFEQLTPQPFELSPLSRSFEELDEKGNDLKMMWEEDKYFDEIIALRLPEPKIEKKSQGQQDGLKNARECLCLKEESQLGSLELSLCWDAVLVKAKPVVQNSIWLDKPSFAMEDVSFRKDKQKEEFEMFERYSMEAMLENQPKYVDSIVSTLPEESTRTTLHDTGQCHVIEQKIYPYCANFDSLSDFLILRSSRPVAAIDQVTTKVQRVIISQESKRAVTNAGITNPVQEAEYNVVPVKISDDLSYLLKELEETALSPMQTLKSCGGISVAYSFHSLTPCITRFFLKQLTLHLKETGYNVSISENYKAAVIVHAMVGAVDLLLNCCLESAICFISAVQEKYNSILKGRLQSVRQKLCDAKVSMHQKQLHHPKVVALCRELDGWFKKQANNQIKTLVLVKRGLHTLMECLEAALHMGNTVIPQISTSCDPQYILQNLKDHNCLLIPCEHVNENFPWVQFSLVVEYEHQDGSPWESICRSHNISWICMKLDHQIDPKYISSESTKNQITGNQALRNEIKLIGSQSFLSYTELLQVLETRYNLQFLERDYTARMYGKEMHFSDIDIDERNCVLLHSLQEVSDESQVERLLERVLALSLKYQHCWMILTAVPNLGRYPLPSNVINSLFKLEATLVNFTNQASDFEIQVLISFELNDVAKLIWTICEECLLMTAEIDSPVHNWLSAEVLKCSVAVEEIIFAGNIFQIIIRVTRNISKCPDEGLQEFVDLTLQSFSGSSTFRLVQVFMDMKFSESSVCLPLNAADITQTSKNDDKKGPSKLYSQQNLETLPSGFKESENRVVEGKQNQSYSKLDAKTCDDNLVGSNDPYSSEGAGNKGSGKSQCLLKDSSLVYHQDSEGICNISTRRNCSLSSQGQTVAFHELTQKPSCYFPVKSQNVGFAELSQNPSVCNDQPRDHYINYGVFGFSDHQISSSISSALRVSGKNLDYSQQKHFPHERMLQESIQQHQLSVDHDAPCTKGKMYNEDGERIKSDLIVQENSSLAPFGAGCLYGKAVREVQGHSYSVEADEDEEVLPLSQPKYKPNQYIIAEMEGKQQSAHQEYFGDLTRRSSNLSFSDEREYINQRSMIEPSENLSISEGSYFDNEYEEHHVLGHDKRFPDFHEMRIRNRVPEPFTTTRSVYMGDNLESAAFCRISFQTECPQKQNEHIYNSSQTQYAYLLGQHENMKGAFSERNLGGHGNTAVHSYPSGNETLPRNMKLLRRDFENNLSKTTRKLLQGPFQFSSFGSYIPRPQQQRIRVGLAQPLRRNTTETEEQIESEKSQMQQSFWTNGDSPPMDFESNPQTPISDLLKLGNDQLRGVNENKSGNRQIYVAAATPRQVRKLAYEKVHGVKDGQTKLVFK